MRTTLVFSLVLIITAGLITGAHYILNPPPDTTPVVIFSENLNEVSGSILEEKKFYFTVKEPQSQIQLNHQFLEDTFGYVTLSNSTMIIIYYFGNFSVITAGTYTSDWIEVNPGNCTLVYTFGGYLVCNITILGRYYPDWMQRSGGER
ncbi:MAG: hypothetical protein ACW98Y_00225 [Candidatus Thorarchaeota archaeon]|jgi:hypothetical protein